MPFDTCVVQWGQAEVVPAVNVSPVIQKEADDVSVALMTGLLERRAAIHVLCIDVRVAGEKQKNCVLEAAATRFH